MSLVRLLTAGKSLVGLKESENRYRVTNQRLLPKFESKKNPFGPGVTSPSECAVAPEPGPQPEAPVAAVPSTSEAPDGQSRPAPLAKSDGLWTRTARWSASRLRSLHLLRRAIPVQAIARRQQQKRLFQAELSLESVKVVRNDLSDTDVEIVTCKKPAAPNEKAAGAEDKDAPNQAWNKLTGSLFGGTKR